MAISSCRQRVQRAKELGEQYPFAREILRLYVEIALFQEKLQGELAETHDFKKPGDLASYFTEIACPANLKRFAAFLNVIKSAGPPRLVRIANDLTAAGEGHCMDLWKQSWQLAGSRGNNVELFLVRAFLQPFAECLGKHSLRQQNGSADCLCPLCGHRPGLAVLRPQGDGRRRSLVCSFCLTEWDFRRIICAGCGEEDHSKLPAYVAEDFNYIRVECCDTCKQYMKAIDLTINGLAEPVVDELASAPLDLWAQEQGYSKIELNLMGM